MGKNPFHRVGYGDAAGMLLVALSVILGMTLVTPAQNSAASSAVLQVICSIFNTIKTVIFVIGLALMILGGAIYAGANLMPSQSRGSFQGYGMAMIIGGVIGVAIAVAAPFILNTVVKVSGASGQVISGSSATLAAQSAAQVCAGLA
ncbi:MAG: hypothetical protein KGH94_02615 [Candidatus Micrarchaeota archaeon]|nr:hypothetical protein [Candidatus Micrarchaeota archaeon]